MSLATIRAHSAGPALGGALVTCAVAFVAFVPVLRLGFLADDFVLVERLGATAAARPTHGGFLRPLTDASLSLDGALYGSWPVGFHLTSVLLHALAAVFVGSLAGALSRRSGAVPTGAARATTVGVLFAAWPCHGEAVAWVACRGDLIAAALGVAALALWLASRPGRVAGRGAALVLFAAALFAKESVVTLPLIVLLVEGVLQRGAATVRMRTAAVSAAPWFAVLAAYVVVRRLALGTLVGGYGAGLHLNPAPVHLAANLGRFTLRACLPWPVLGRAVETRPTGLVVLGAILVAVALGGALALRRSGGPVRGTHRALLAAGLAFPAAVLPVLNLGVSTHTAENERLLYFPSVFAVIAAVELIALVVRPLWARRTAAVAVPLACLALQPAVLAPWRAAATITAATLQDLQAAGDGVPLLVLGLPDSVQGVSVFRHGLPEALRLRGVSRQVVPIAFAVLAGPHDRVIAHAEGPRLELRGSSPRDRLYSRFRDPASGVVRRSAEGALPAGGFLVQGPHLTVDLGSFGAAEPVCFANPGLTRCAPPGG